VRHRTSLKNRIHATLLALGHACPTSDLFGVDGRALLARLALPAPWAGNVAASLALIDDLEAQIDACELQLRRLGADHPYVALLLTVPGIAWVLGYTIAAEIGDIARFPSPKRLCGYTGLCPRVSQSAWPRPPRPARQERPTLPAVGADRGRHHAACHPAYRQHYQRTRQRLGRQRGPKVARVEVARKLAEAIWHMLTRTQPFRPAPARPPHTLWSPDDPRMRWASREPPTRPDPPPRRR
jgi:transposase